MTGLRFAIDICPLGELSDPRAIVRLGRAAEDSGWHGLSIWDSLGLSMGTVAADPFVTLASLAEATSRLRLITSIIALSRRRPQLVVQAAATLDIVSEGRLILGLGAGEDRPDFEAFGDAFQRPERIDRMDEALGLVDRGLRGEPLEHAGPLVQAAGGVVLGPRPLQQPRPPIWLGAMKPGGIRRAAAWEGWIVVAMSEEGTSMAMTPDVLAARLEIARATRRDLGRAGEPFDVAVLGVSAGSAASVGSGSVGAGPADVREFEKAGATWWLESLSPMRGSLDGLMAIVHAGPPR
jgi:alkanesulfonate monooxygenase SsuD/methylene tetrahydromethanopterin reductase-like flavin-dependent oxidoreductase (luciferase family)